MHKAYCRYNTFLNVKICLCESHQTITVFSLFIPSVDCQGKPNGNYKDPNNCHGYIACSNGNTHYKDCAPATPQLVYNEQTDQCVYPSELACWSDSGE